MLGDFIGPISSLVLILTVNALGMLTIWPVSSSVAPLVVFIVVNGIGSGAVLSLIASVASSVHWHGNTRTENALVMTVSGWGLVTSS